MAKRKKKQKHSLSLVPLISISLVFAALILITLNERLQSEALPTWKGIYETISQAAEEVLRGGNTGNQGQNSVVASGEIEVHILDVGQADSILIKTPHKNVLIDAGENEDGETVVRYLRSQNVTRIDLLIATHPHADHIGGMDVVVEKMAVDKVMMAKLPDEIVPTTRVYTDLLSAIAQKGLKITPADPAIRYNLGGGATLQILTPLAEFNSLNEMSIATRLDFGESSFLFTGDIEKNAENSLLQKGTNIDVDVLSAAHHGSSTSSQKKFLEKVTPKLTTISVGADNTYGHPHKEVVERLLQYGPIYRTDLHGTLVLRCDGETIWVIPQQGEPFDLVA